MLNIHFLCQFDQPLMVSREFTLSLPKGTTSEGRPTPSSFDKLRMSASNLYFVVPPPSRLNDSDVTELR